MVNYLKQNKLKYKWLQKKDKNYKQNIKKCMNNYIKILKEKVNKLK